MQDSETRTLIVLQRTQRDTFNFSRRMTCAIQVSTEQAFLVALTYMQYTVIWTFNAKRNIIGYLHKIDDG